MSSKFIKNLCEYESLKKDSSKLPFYSSFRKIFFSCIALLCTISFIGYEFINKHLIIIIPLTIGFLTPLLGFMFNELEELYNSKFNKIRVLEKTIENDAFTGELSEIFNMECPITLGVFKQNADIIEKDIYEHKGLSGTLYFSLKKIIISLKESIELEIQEKEEKEALKNANTTIGSMLKNIEIIKNS